MTSLIEQGRAPERSDILLMDPSVLMRYNPAALIVHKESYDRMAARFEPDALFELPHVVRVKIFSSEQSREVARYFVIDGMTRTKYVADHQQEIAQEHPNFRFSVKDTTAAYLRNDKIVYPEEKTEGQEALTMVQYLRAVIPPTIEHAQIAPDRIAAHLINGWSNMVGPNLAGRYSALAALSFLGNQSINIATDQGLKRDLERQPRLMENETRDERDQLKQCLFEMGVVIRESKIPNRQELVKSAFLLVGTESPVIGGEIESRRQIYGLLHTPAVEKKLTEAYETMGEREQMRYQLGDFLVESFRRAGRALNRQEVLNALGEALRNPLLDYAHTLDVITSPTPLPHYSEVIQEVNKDRLTKAYVAPDIVEPLSPVETQLIEKFGSRVNLSDDDIWRFVQAINVTNAAQKSAEALKNRITTNRDQLLEQSVTNEVLDQAMIEIQRDQREINSANTPQTLLGRSQKLANTVNEKTRRIANQITQHRIGGMIDVAGGDRLKEGYGVRARDDIRDLVFGEFVEITEQNQSQIQQRIQELLSLDDDLLRRIRGGEISLKRALQTQGARSVPVLPKPGVPPTIPPITIDKTPTVVPPRTPPIKPPTLPPDETIIDARQLEQIRKEHNREQYRKRLTELRGLLNELDLTPEDITASERQLTDEVVIYLGRLVYKWPDAARILREEYRRLLEENRRLHEELVGRRREDTDRDTRTGR